MKHQKHGLLALFCLLLVCGGCSSDSSAPRPSLAVITYNTGLAKGYVPAYTQRLPAVIAAVADADADVVCLQEVWKDEDVAAIVEAAKTAFPYTYWERTQQEEGAVCSQGEEVALLDCAAANCAQVDPDNLADCVLRDCPTEFLALSADCRSCLVANLGNNLDEIGEACATGATPAGLWSYDGRNGVLLLSRFPLHRTESYELSSYLVKRVVLHVRIDHDHFGTLDLYGTHLTADLGNAPPYAGEADSWLAEQGLQIDAMLAWIEATAEPGNPVVLMGDMNCGPEKSGVQGAAVENYNALLVDGWQVPYAETEAAACTFCGDNPLVGDGSGDVLIDHVLLNRWSGGITTSAERIFDTAVPLETEDGPVDLPLSDHYGVRVDIGSR